MPFRWELLEAMSVLVTLLMPIVILGVLIAFGIAFSR